MNALLLIALTTAAPPEAPTLRLGDARSSEGGVTTLTLTAPPRALRAVEPHISRQRLVFFVPGVQGRNRTQLFASGPVKKIQSKSAARGVVIIVHGRAGNAGKLANSVRFPKSAPWQLRIFGKTGVEALSSPQSRPAARGTAFTTRNRGERQEQARTPTQAPQIAATSPDATGIAKTGNNTAQAGMHTLELAPSSSSTRGWAFALAGLLVLVALAGWWKQRRGPRMDDGDGIEIVAVQTLGPKHRLALVESCGDRFLVAATENGVQLLSPMPSSDAPTPFDNTLAEQLSTPEHASEDVAGIVRLRRRQTRTLEALA